MTVRFEDADNPMTVENLILLLQSCPQDALVYAQDVGCGCCSYYTGVGVEVKESVDIHEIEAQPKRVVLFGGMEKN